MPRQNVPKFINKSVSHHSIGFNLKRPKAIKLDEQIEIIRKHLEKGRKADYVEKMQDRIDKGQKYFYIPHNYATKGNVLELIVNYYIDNELKK